MPLYRHGLSYTTFQYSDLEVPEPRPRENEIEITAEFTVKNTGSVAGSEIAQLYISWPSDSSASHPPLRLKSFTKLRLEAGQVCFAQMHMTKYAVSSWNESSERWVVENGSYTVFVGSSSQELPLSATMTIKSGFEWTGL